MNVLCSRLFHIIRKSDQSYGRCRGCGDKMSERHTDGKTERRMDSHIHGSTSCFVNQFIFVHTLFRKFAAECIPEIINIC